MSNTVYIAVLLFFAFILGILACRQLLRSHYRKLNRLVGEDCIDIAKYIELGGVQQWITIRGRSKNNPVLLFLHGGPGSVFSGVGYSFQTPWEEFFTVVNWDQRGSGRSKVGKAQGKVTFEQIYEDALKLINYLQKELGQEKVFLFSHSWGSFVGLHIAKHHPQLLHAYMGLGQLTGVKANCEAIYQVVLAEARRRNDERNIKKLEKAGPAMPEPDSKDYLKWVGTSTFLLPGYGLSWRNQTSIANLFGRVLIKAFVSPHISLKEILTPLGGSRSYAEHIFKGIHGIHLPESLGYEFDTPIIFISGKYDQQAPIQLAKDYHEKIQAPVKQFHVLENSAHVGVWEESGHLLKILIEDALPLAN